MPFYPLYDDLVDELQDLATANDIVSLHQLTTVSWSEGGGTVTKPVVAVKVSDNADSEEDEPAFVFTGLIHGIEPLGVNVLLWLLREWVEDYGDPGKPEIQDWVDNSEIWLVPVLNVYGYMNIQRKNHEDIDLARNYGFRWDECDGCDYVNTSDDNYPGPSAFSARESRAMRDLFLQQRPIFSITFHAGPFEVMRPWSPRSTLTSTVTLTPTDHDSLVDFQNEIQSDVLAEYGNGDFCVVGSDIHNTVVCSNFDTGTLGPYGQPENWYQAYGGALAFVVEMAPSSEGREAYRDCCFYDPTHCSGCSDCITTSDCPLSTAMACEHVRVYQELIRSLLDKVPDGPGATGTITDRITGQRLSATVEIAGRNDDQDVDGDGNSDGAKRTSDPLHGRYWRFLQSGTHTIEVSKPGYEPASASVTVGATGFTTRNFALTPRLEILHPTPEFVAYAGRPHHPRTFVVRLQLGSPGDPCVTGLDFTVELRDDENNWVEATPGPAACVQDHYWLPVTPRSTGRLSFTEDRVYDLRVAIDTVSAVSRDSVQFSDISLDSVLVMDVSGSMDTGGKLEAAQQAAELLVHELSDDDQGALVSFSGDGIEPGGAPDDADLELPLDLMRHQRDALIDAIQDLDTEDTTSIGDGLLVALQEVDDGGNPDHRCALVLLSDGMENEPELWSTVRDDVEDSPCVVHVVGLGPESEEDLLEDISQTGGGGEGTFEYATITGPMAPILPLQGGGAGVGGLPTWRNNLAGIFDSFTTRLTRRQRIFSAAGQSGSAVFERVVVDGTIGEVVFALKWERKDSTALQLTDPDGRVIRPGDLGVVIRKGGTDQVYRITAPRAGVWKAQIVRQPNFDNAPYLLLVSGQTSLELILILSSQLHPTERGDAVLVGALLTMRNRPVVDAEVTASVTAPHGGTSRLILHDDGAHADGGEKDGFYANWYLRTVWDERVNPDAGEGQELAVRGSYTVNVLARRDDDFRREATGSFVTRDARDSDEDGMPDSYEKRNGLDPDDAGDRNLDLDLEGLRNFDEFLLGTDPRNSDTDGGGENDLSEVRNQRDPLWPSDDAMRPVEGFTLELAPSVVRVHWTPVQGLTYAVWRWHHSPQDSEWKLLDSQLPSTGAFEDRDVTNGATYSYRMMAANVPANLASAITSPLTATPRADPTPPRGSVVINDDAPTSESRDVMLSFEATFDTRELRVGSLHELNDDLSHLPWRRFSDELRWSIPPDVRGGDTFVIYAQFRDAAGNESTIVHDEIMLEVKEGLFVRGDCNGDGQITGNVTDAVFLFTFLFVGGQRPGCLAACDVNGDGSVIGSVTDGVYLLRFNFRGGPRPPRPFPDCGPGTAADERLGCQVATGACR